MARQKKAPKVLWACPDITLMWVCQVTRLYRLVGPHKRKLCEGGPCAEIRSCPGPVKYNLDERSA